MTISSINKFNIPEMFALWYSIQMRSEKVFKFQLINKHSFSSYVHLNYENIIFKYDKEKFYPNIPNEAQNEFCRLIYNPKKNIICCMQIWEKESEKFFITGDKKILQGLIKEAPNYLSPFEKFAELLKDFQNLSEVQVHYTPQSRPIVMNVEKKDLSCIKTNNQKKAKKQSKKERMRKRLQETKVIDKIDINNADLDPIRKLPGINVVIAKRIINKREEINGFNTVQEILDFININPRMSQILKEQICVKPIKINPVTMKHKEINVDL